MSQSLSFYSNTSSPGSSDECFAAYLSYLEQRNGKLAGEGAFARREDTMVSFDRDLYQSHTKVDCERFNRNYADFRERDVSEEEMALMAFVKINAGEAYGVEKTREARSHLWDSARLCDEISRVVLAEEDYHTRLLVGATGHFPALNLGNSWSPPWPLRILIGGIAKAPQVLMHPLLLAAEVSGLHAFNWLLTRLSSLFPDEPQLRESMEERLIEVMTDELGHVAFNRILVGTVGRRVAAGLAAMISQSHRVMSKEMVALGFDGATMVGVLNFDYYQLPQTVRDRGFFV